MKLLISILENNHLNQIVIKFSTKKKEEMQKPTPGLNKRLFHITFYDKSTPTSGKKNVPNFMKTCLKRSA